MEISHGGIDKVDFLWTLRGLSPLWTRATITIRGLKSPSTWIYDSSTYRNHVKNLRVIFAFNLPITSVEMSSHNSCSWRVISQQCQHYFFQMAMVLDKFECPSYFLSARVSHWARRCT